jgi:molybdopterin/thiamine biosynthesis adenylyltransferase
MALFSDAAVERYARHIVLSEVGGPGQQKLAGARVLIVGAGGVGGPAGLYLAAAGVGMITLVDDDVVSLSNLQRQIQFTDADIGQEKARVAASRMALANPHVRIEPRMLRLDGANAPALVRAHDIIIDGTDNFETRLILNAACIAASRPLVSGALGRWSGQVAVFTGQPCYQCLIAEIPPDAETCAQMGVIGALAGVIGSMAALEAIKLITGAGQALTGRLLLYDGLTGASRTVRLAADPRCPVCSDQAKALENSAT